jgi:exodeoxyribonuclease-3
VARERPDVLCLQEIKAKPEQVPAALCSMEGYWCYWYGRRRLLRGGPARAPGAGAEQAGLHPPAFDFENRIAAVEVAGLTVASVYVPNGGKDLPAKLRFFDALIDWAAASRAEGRKLVICGDLNIARAEMDVHPKERKVTVPGQLPVERAGFERLLGQGLVDVARALDRRTTSSSPGGPRGGTCASATSAGASTTCWPVTTWRLRRGAVSRSARWARAIMPRCWRTSIWPSEDP